MGRFVVGAERDQTTLFPPCLEDWIAEDNPVRVVDAFVEALELGALGFAGVDAARTGRPGYHPAALLKLYVYGYLNRVPLSRRLAREAGRNVEVMWLTGQLSPDHKTIAEFRRQNGPAIERVCARFVALCRTMGLLTGTCVAIDGSKFKAVNNRGRNFTQGKLDRRRQQIEESVSRYLSQLDTADRQDPTPELAAEVERLKEKVARLGQGIERLAGLEEQMKAAPDRQVSLTDPDARSMATSGRGSGVVGYNVQVAVETEHHLIVAHAVTNAGSDRAQLSGMAARAKDALEADTLDAVADLGYYSSEQILACKRTGIAVTLPRPLTSGAKAVGRFGKDDFFYRRQDNTYLCPAGQTLSYRHTLVENGLTLHRYWTNVCSTCAMKGACTTGKERRVTRWEHEDGLETVQRRLDGNPLAMRVRRETVEHPFGTLKARMGATHFLTKTLPRVSTEMALQVLAYNLTRVLNIMGSQKLLAAIPA